MITRDIIIHDILIPSLNILYQSDHDNIRFGVSERNICARLAHHMENIMREYDCSNNSNYFCNYYADVEYNRMGNGDPKQYKNSEHRPKYMVSDLLIQSRGRKRNYLAVEMKRKGNYRNAKDDRERLASMVSPAPHGMHDRCVHDTLVGAFIIYGVEGVKIELFENVNGRGENTETFESSRKELREQPRGPLDVPEERFARQLTLW